MRNFWQLQHVAACVQEAVRVTKHPPPNKAKLIIMVAWQLWHIIFNILIQTQDQRIITSQVTGYFQDWTFGRYLNQRRDKADYVAFYPVAMCVIRCESSMKIPFFQTDRRGFSTVTSCSVVPITRSVRSPVYTRTKHTCASVRALIRTCKVRASQAPPPSSFRICAEERQDERWAETHATCQKQSTAGGICCRCTKVTTREVTL